MGIKIATQELEEIGVKPIPEDCDFGFESSATAMQQSKA